MAMVQCTSCIARIPAGRVEEWGGQCPKCRGNEQKAKPRTARTRNLPQGYVVCNTPTCNTQIHSSLVEQWNGICPLCQKKQQ